MNKPLLSVVTPVKENRDAIMVTYRSLKNLLDEGLVEYVVQDWCGKSNLDDIVKTKNVVISAAKDRNVTHGANIAAANASGDYITFWGSGERSIEDQMRRALILLERNRPDILFNYMRTERATFIPSPERIKVAMNCLTPASFIKKDLFHKVDGLDERYMIACDYEMFVKLLKVTTNYLIADFVVVDFSHGGMSDQKALEGALECELIRMRQHGKSQLLSALDTVKSCHNLIRQQVQVQASANSAL